MPSGRYVVIGVDGGPVGSEDFRCAPGPAGWRYFSDLKSVEPTPHDAIVDVAVDGSWRPVRVRIETGAHTLLLLAEGELLTGFHDGAAVEIPWGPDVHLSFPSPSFTAISCARLAATAEVEVVWIEPFTLNAVPRRHGYELMGPEPIASKMGVFDSTRWRVLTPAAEMPRDVWVASDVVVAYEGAFELTAYEAGASGPRPRPSP